MKHLDDKVAAVTGAGSGIGRALALHLADRRCRLALSDVDTAGLAETERLLEGAVGQERTLRHVVHPTHHDSARARGAHSGEEVEQRRLPGAGLARDHRQPRPRSQ